jgi:hypothetical protein
MKRLLGAVLLFSVLSFGADITGTWSGPMEMKRGGETRQDSAHLVLTQSGNDVKGTAGPTAERQWAIKKGSVNGEDIQLEVENEQGRKMVLQLKVDGEKLTGDLKGEGGDGEPFTGKMVLSRQK